jgi:hypothetical protein
MARPHLLVTVFLWALAKTGHTSSYTLPTRLQQVLSLLNTATHPSNKFTSIITEMLQSYDSFAETNLGTEEETMLCG